MNSEQSRQNTEEEKLEVEKELFKNSRAIRVGQSIADYRAEMNALWDKMHPEKVEAAELVPNKAENIPNNGGVSNNQQERKAEESEKRRQEDLRVVRQELGLDTPQKRETLANDNTKEPEDLEVTTVYKRVSRAKKSSLSDDLFMVANGAVPETYIPFKKVSGEIGLKFDSHGLDKDNQLERLLALLKNGIDNSKPFYTAPFELPKGIRAQMGAALGTSGGTAYKGGLAVITSGYDERLTESGIKHVFINDVYGELVGPLSKQFPQYNFHLLSEQKRVMDDEYLNNKKAK